MKREILLPAAALTGGTAGFFLRRAELAAAYDPVTRLMSSDHPAGRLLIGLAVLLGAVFLLGSRGAGKRGLGAQQWFRAPHTGYMMLVVCAGLVLMLAGAAGLWEQSRGGQRDLIRMAACILSVLGGAAALMAGRSTYRMLWSEQVSILLMGPAFAALLWLVSGYQAQARQPEVRLFVWQILAGVAALLALYGLVTLSLDKGGAMSTCVTGLLGISLSLITLADGHGLAFNLFYLFCAVYLTAQTYMLLRGAFGAPWPQRMPDRAEEDEDDKDDGDDIRSLFGTKD